MKFIYSISIAAFIFAMVMLGIRGAFQLQEKMKEPSRPAANAAYAEPKKDLPKTSETKDVLKINKEVIMENKNVLNEKEAMDLVTAKGPTIRYDKTGQPWFPENRKDVAIIQRDAEDGSTYGRTVWYIAYNNGKGTQLEKLHDSGNTHDNCHTWSVEIIEGILTVRIGYGGYEPTLKKKLSELGLPD